MNYGIHSQHLTQITNIILAAYFFYDNSSITVYDSKIVQYQNGEYGYNRVAYDSGHNSVCKTVLEPLTQYWVQIESVYTSTYRLHIETSEIEETTSTPETMPVVAPTFLEETTPTNTSDVLYIVLQSYIDEMSKHLDSEKGGYSLYDFNGDNIPECFFYIKGLDSCYVYVWDGSKIIESILPYRFVSIQKENGNKEYISLHYTYVNGNDWTEYGIDYKFNPTTNKIEEIGSRAALFDKSHLWQKGSVTYKIGNETVSEDVFTNWRKSRNNGVFSNIEWEFFNSKEDLKIEKLAKKWKKHT